MAALAFFAALTLAPLMAIGDSGDIEDIGDSGTWTLGGRSLDDRAASEPLIMASSGRDSILRYGFAAKIAGVTFECAATPGPGVAGRKISLSYDPAREDGARLAVSIGTAQARPYLPDWQLKPIAHFADRDETAIVTLFGEGEDSAKHLYIRNHPAVRDSLLAMRLLQADLLLLNPLDNWDLPRWNDRAVMGAGETGRLETEVLEAAFRLHQIMTESEPRSWILTDAENGATIRLEDGRLTLDSKPYYLFWDESPRVLEQLGKLEQLYDSAAAMDRRLQSETEAFNVKVEAYHAPWTSAERQVELFLELTDREVALDSKESELSRIIAEIRDLESKIADTPVREATALTRRMARNEDALRAVNPAVHDAVSRTARFCGLFRYVQRSNPDNWADFHTAVSKIDLDPLVTPTRMSRR